MSLCIPLSSLRWMIQWQHQLTENSLGHSSVSEIVLVWTDGSNQKPKHFASFAHSFSFPSFQFLSFSVKNLYSWLFPGKIFHKQMFYLIHWHCFCKKLCFNKNFESKLDGCSIKLLCKDDTSFLSFRLHFTSHWTFCSARTYFRPWTIEIFSVLLLSE